MTGVPDDPDDLAPQQLPIGVGVPAHLEGETLADWIDVVKYPVDQRLVDDRDRRAVGGVVVGEVAAAHQLNAHRTEVARARRLKQRRCCRAIWRRGRVA